MTFKSEISVSSGSSALPNISLSGFLSQIFWGLVGVCGERGAGVGGGRWGWYLPSAVSPTREPDMGSNLSLLEDDLYSCDISPFSGPLTWVCGFWFYWVSTPPTHLVFHFCSVENLSFLFSEIISVHSLILVCPWTSPKFRAFLLCHFSHLPQKEIVFKYCETFCF